MKNILLKNLFAGAALAACSAQAGDDTSIVTSATLCQIGLTVEDTGINVDLTDISATYDDWIFFTFETSTAVNVTETSFRGIRSLLVSSPLAG